jgi:hypothetical protein
MFHILEERFIGQMENLYSFIETKYGDNCEGSIFWKEWANSKGVKLIQDVDLRLPNSINYGKKDSTD